MQIKVRRTGGFAGIEEELGSVDTASLEGGAREQLETLVREVDFFSLPAAIEGEVGADQFRYEVTVEDGGRGQTVVFTGEGGPQAEALRRLTDAVAAAS